MPFQYLVCFIYLFFSISKFTAIHSTSTFSHFYQCAPLQPPKPSLPHTLCKNNSVEYLTSLSEELRVLSMSPQIYYSYFIYLPLAFIPNILAVFQVFEITRNPPFMYMSLITIWGLCNAQIVCVLSRVLAKNFSSLCRSCDIFVIIPRWDAQTTFIISQQIMVNFKTGFVAESLVEFI